VEKGSLSHFAVKRQGGGRGSIGNYQIIQLIFCLDKLQCGVYVSFCDHGCSK
jgi:hypothetical protein